MPKRKNLRVSYWNHSMGTIPPFPNEGYKTMRLRSHPPDRLLERDVFIQSKQVEFSDEQRGDQKNDQNDAVQQKGTYEWTMSNPPIRVNKKVIGIIPKNDATKIGRAHV